MNNSGKLFKYMNCRLIRDGDLIEDDLWVRDGIIVNPEYIFFSEKVTADVTVDCDGAILCPGFIDVQINGNQILVQMLCIMSIIYFHQPKISILI